MAHRILFTADKEVKFDEFSPPPLDAGLVRVRALYSLMSTGTENIVLNQLYERDSEWGKLTYPRGTGYSFVGVVEEIGPGVLGLQVGDRVAGSFQHASVVVDRAENCIRIPDHIDARDAVWFALAKIAFIGARAANYSLGKRVVIVGAGPIGQMSVRWAAAAGLRSIVAVDAMELRLKLAHAGGANATVALPLEHAAPDIRTALGGQDPALIMDTTGNEKVFGHALSLAGRKARIVVLGDTGTPSQQCLSSHVLRKGLTIVGAHNSLNDEIWNTRTIVEFLFGLMQSGRFSVAGLNTHYFAPADCRSAYALANTRRGETMGIVFDWTR